MTDAEKEQKKLTANWLNTLATAGIAVGFIAPSVNFLFGQVPPAPWWQLILVLLIWLSIGIVLHLLGRALLRGL
jgi:cobalamin synthase